MTSFSGIRPLALLAPTALVAALLGGQFVAAQRADEPAKKAPPAAEPKNVPESAPFPRVDEPLTPEEIAEEKAAAAREAAKKAAEDKAANEAAAAAKSDIKPIELSKDLKKLTDNIYIDSKNKWVVLDGEIVLRKGPPLEMFACLKNTKEHESIVAVAVKAFQVHSALLAVGAKQGTPVQFQPEYKPAKGEEIEIRILWTDAKGKTHQARAQDWIRDIKTKKPMAHPFIFAGSGFWTDDETGERHYMAEGGELICVSNFSSAMLDLPVASSASTDSLLFEAFSDHIPAEGTKVRLVLMPKEQKKAGDKKAGDKTPDKATEKPAAETPQAKPSVAPSTANK
jgi:hypothetical protein